MALMDAGKTEEACPKLARSQQLEPDMKTQFRLGQCYEKLGKTASAWSIYQDVVKLAHDAKRQDREDFARKAADAIEGKLARVVLVVPAEVAGLAGFSVKVDGKGVDRAAWEKGVPVDPGEHAVGVTADGRKAWGEKRSVKASEKVAVKVPVLEAIAASSAKKEPEVVKVPPPVQENPVSPAKPSLIPGIALGAGAVAGIAAGAALLVVSSGKAGDTTSLSDSIGRGGCSRTPADPRCTDLTDLAKGADSLHNAGVGVLIGAAALGAGSGAYFLWRSRKGQKKDDVSPAAFEVRAIPVVGAGHGGLLIHGAF
ncbi:MAG: hypothetical protein U0359_21550 [Byssovorax sp.]